MADSGKKLSASTIAKLKALKARVLKYPERYDQRDWCGTQACLAGFCLPKAFNKRAVTMNYDELDGLRYDSEKYTGRSASDIAADYLGLNLEQSGRLFRAVWHGEAYKFNRIRSHSLFGVKGIDDTDEQAAKKAADRIDLFIATDGEV